MAEALPVSKTTAMLYASLLGQKKYVHAEQLRLPGYEGMKQREAKIPKEGKTRLPETLERIVKLHDATGRRTRRRSGGRSGRRRKNPKK